ncbi:VOC family protein [Virgibacillus sp. Bac330]|uniref:VOC family protein n=1 Tax=Virgibacillus sp. Bac330 TaxID=2419841 RepID=UPI000EF47511|nr:VOC family protein [Virgibacillus sp. Bac330]
MEAKFFGHSVAHVNEVSIYVTNLEYSLAFYQYLFDFSLLEKSQHQAVLSANGATPILTLEQPESVLSKQQGRTGLYHFAILLPNRSDLASFLQFCLEEQIPFGASDHHVSEAIYLTDPDGNGIEVYRDRPSSRWKWDDDQIMMTTYQLDTAGLLAEPSSNWEGAPKESLIGHIHLHVNNLEQVKAFYVKILGFTEVAHYPGALFLSTGDYHHHIAINVWNGENALPPEKYSAGLKYFSIAFPKAQAIDLIHDQLKKKGWHAIRAKDGEGLYVDDPSGNEIFLSV